MKQGFHLKFKETPPDSRAYIKLFETTGWNDGYQVDKLGLGTAISNSWFKLSVYNDENELVGFGRVVSDGVLYAFICDMIVAPDYQNQGIGSEILKRLIRQCQESGIRVLWLFAAADKSGFYQKHGFKNRHHNAPGMQLNLNIRE